jgi:hypothetical protein
VATPGKYKAIVWTTYRGITYGKVIEIELKALSMPAK